MRAERSRTEAEDRALTISDPLAMARIGDMGDLAPRAPTASRRGGKQGGGPPGAKRLGRPAAERTPDGHAAGVRAVADGIHFTPAICRAIRPGRSDGILSRRDLLDGNRYLLSLGPERQVVGLTSTTGAQSSTPVRGCVSRL